MPSRSAHAPLLGFDVPLQRMERRAPVSSRRFQPPARSVPGDSHPFDVLLRPSSGRACFIPSYAHGVHPFAAASLRPFDRLETSRSRRSRVHSSSDALSSAGAPHGVLLQGFHSLHSSPDFSPGLPLLHFELAFDRLPGPHAPAASEFRLWRAWDFLGRIATLRLSTLRKRHGTRPLPSGSS